MKIDRALFQLIKSRFFKGKAIILTGSRQTGKTTLLKQLVADEPAEDVLFLNCDEPDILPLLENATSTVLKNLIGHKRIILIDEAQRVKNIGITLKLITDNMDSIQLIVTGSSSLDIQNRLSESLTGRKIEYLLYPFSTGELVTAGSQLEEKRMLEQRLVYGMYPDIVNHPPDARILLTELANSYLFKDILAYKDIRRPDELNRLLTALSLQVGSEVSYSELRRTVDMDKETIERYLDLLEKVFIIFRLPAFSRDLRTEPKKNPKIYFYDNGIRNALINNFQPISIRNDKGALWENFIISERKKYNEYRRITVNTYFWRTFAQQEIDYIEERDGCLYAFECKWNEDKKARLPQAFAETYPEHCYSVINPSNYMDFL
jgi:predicted AAA+ superfamily ATPase